MKIRLQADADLHAGIVRGLKRHVPEIDFRPAKGFIPDGMADRDVLQLAAADGRVLISADLRTMGKHFASFIATEVSPGMILLPSRIGLGAAIRRLHDL